MFSSSSGGFDERFGSYLEDVDLGLRCLNEGLTGVYVPGAIAYHHGSATFGRWDRAGGPAHLAQSAAARFTAL